MGVRDVLHFWGLAVLILPDVLGDSWGVWYSENRICAVEKSTVIIPCRYTYPDKNMDVTFVIWCKTVKCYRTGFVYHSNKVRTIEEGFEGRAQYHGDKQNNCTLMIKYIRDEDSGNYSFRFEAGGSNKWSAVTAVELKVTELTVKKTSSGATEPIKEGDTVTLTCDTTNCKLNQSEIILLKNKQLFPGLPSSHQFNSISHQDSGNYSCALKDNITISSKQIILDVQSKHSAQLPIILVVGIALTVLAAALVAIVCFKRRKGKGQTEDPWSAKGAQNQDPASSPQEVEVSYASVHFKKRLPKIVDRSAPRQEEQAEESIIYSAVKR